MFSCVALPTILIRVLVDLIMLAIAVVYVLPRARTPGLMIAAAAALNAVVGLSVPTLEILGLGIATNNGNEWMFVGYVFSPMVQPFAQAVNGACLCVAMVLLAKQLPVDRDSWDA